jgi:hypothetical protein
MNALSSLPLLIAMLPATVAAEAVGTDPIASYASCVAQSLMRIDAYVHQIWISRAARLPRLLDAQADGLRCAGDAYVAAQSALAAEPDRRRALGRHYAKLKSLIALRTPEPATESKRQYAARIAADDAKLERLWREVLAPDAITAAPEP